jgi:hypothetical protein
VPLHRFDHNSRNFSVSNSRVHNIKCISSEQEAFKTTIPTLVNGHMTTAVVDYVGTDKDIGEGLI